MKRESLRGGALSNELVEVAKEPALSAPNGRCAKLSVVDNFAPERRVIIHHSKFFSETVINKKLSTQVILSGKEDSSRAILKGTS